MVSVNSASLTLMLFVSFDHVKFHFKKNVGSIISDSVHNAYIRISTWWYWIFDIVIEIDVIAFEVLYWFAVSEKLKCVYLEEN